MRESLAKPARKLPRRHYRANTPSAAFQKNPRPTPNPTPHFALHRIRTPPGEVVARRAQTRSTQAAETPLSSQHSLSEYAVALQSRAHMSVALFLVCSDLLERTRNS